MVFVEYHLDIREGNGQNIEAAVMRVVFFLCCGDIVPAEVANHVLLFGMKLGNDLFFLPHHIVQGLTVTEVDFVGNVVYRHDRYKAAAVYLEKAVTQGVLQFVHRHSCFINLVAESMYLGIVPFHQDIENRTDCQSDFLPV